MSQKKTADVYCFTIEKHEGDSPVEYISYKKYDGVKCGSDFLMFQYQNGCFRPEACRNIYNKSLLVDNECYFTKGILHEDDEWTPRVLIKANAIVVSTFSSYVYVIRENSIMKQTKFNRHIESLKFMIEKYDNQDFGFGEQLKRLILDRMINNYISCFAKGQFYKEKQYYMPYSFFKDKIVFFRTRVKVYLFCFNKRLFCAVSKFITK